MKTNTYWFKQKKYGYGVTPKTWEGWVSLPVFIILILAGAKLFQTDSYFYAFITIVVLVYVWLTKAKTKDPWEWRWG